MRPAIICAAIIASITATLASAPVVIMDRNRQVRSSAYPLLTQPHTVTYALVAFTGLSPGCVLMSGCRCFRWAGTSHGVRWPPMAPGETSCINVTMRLKETSDSVVPLAALLPVAEIPILWHIIRNKVCARPQTGLNEALTELTVAMSARTVEVCVRARLLPDTGPRSAGADPIMNYSMLAMAVVVAGVLVLHLHL